MTELTRPDGAVIHYDTFGTGEPVLALSGWCGSMAESLVESLSTEFNVITMDQRHVGRSRAPLAPFSYEAALGDQLAVLDALGVDRTHIFATGFGCSDALRLLYEAPARVTSAVLREPAGRDVSNTMDVFFDLFRDTIRIARAEGLEGVIAAAVDDAEFISHPGGGPWAQRLHDDPVFRDTLRSIGRENYIALIVDFRDGVFPWDRACFSLNDVAVGRIRAPVLVVPGDDARYPRGAGTWIAAEVMNGLCLERASLTPERVRAFFEGGAALDGTSSR